MKKEAAEKAAWWKESVFYEVYMPSFKDRGGQPGFKGLRSALDYFGELGVKGIWLTPFLQSPKVDNGYDVSDYRMIDPAYGTLDDFKVFLGEAHERGIRVIMDMVVNHSSTEHAWFQEARKSKDNQYRDYYLWTDSPNNWESFFGGSAWELDALSGQYYYHQFDVQMADLNWANPKLVEEVLSVLRFWLDIGVDGFRMDVINFLSTDGIGPDNPVRDGKQEHLHDIDRPGVKEAIRKIKSAVNEYPDRFIVGEVGSDKIEVLSSYQSEELLDLVFNFNFGSIPEFSAQRIFDELLSMEERMPGYPSLFFGSHDMPRLMSRLAENKPARAEALAVLMLSARGVPFIYNGEEIGMVDAVARTFEDIQDIQARTQYALALKNGCSDADALVVANRHNRDKSRGSMPWDHGENPILKVYKKAIALRNAEPVFQYGTYKDLSFRAGCISFTRKYQEMLVRGYFNFGETAMEVVLEPGENVLLGSEILQPDGYLIIQVN
ncbi:MAG: glucohydrolase [Saprospirales bacterium]|nr:glucohydrolase [Saprospirales bacterium]